MGCPQGGKLEKPCLTLIRGGLDVLFYFTDSWIGTYFPFIIFSPLEASIRALLPRGTNKSEDFSWHQNTYNNISSSIWPLHLQIALPFNLKPLNIMLEPLGSLSRWPSTLAEIPLSLRNSD